MEVATAAQPVRRPSFHGSAGTLFGIQLINLLLTIVTLGIYSFWGKTKVRGYLWSQTEFEGDRFAYHGTGKEVPWEEQLGQAAVHSLVPPFARCTDSARIHIIDRVIPGSSQSRRSAGRAADGQASGARS